MSDRKVIPSGKSINGYQIVFIIGVGGFGGIYKVKDKKTNQVFAMKTENLDTQKKTLPNEIECLKNLKDDFFPKLRESGTSTKYNINFLIMNLLGPSIGGIQTYHHKKLDKEIVYNVSYNMLRVLKAFHSYGYVHCDIKPSNFLIQQNPKAPLVLIDFGLCQKHIDPQTNQPVPFRTGLVFSGTRKYASIFAHQGCLQGRRDDIISWFYSFLDLFCGSLPWENVKNTRDVINLKGRLILSDIGDFPPQIEEIYKYIKTLKYEDKPRYGYMGKLLQQAMESEGYRLTEFGWFSFYSNHASLINLQKTMSLNLIKEINKKNHEKEEKSSKSNKSIKKSKSEPIKCYSSKESTEKSKSHCNHHHKSHHKKDTLPPPIPADNNTNINDNDNSQNYDSDNETNSKNNKKEKHRHKDGKDCEIQ